MHATIPIVYQSDPKFVLILEFLWKLWKKYYKFRNIENWWSWNWNFIGVIDFKMDQSKDELVIDRTDLGFSVRSTHTSRQ